VPEIELLYIPSQHAYYSKLSGMHNVSNMAATACICRFYGCNENAIASGISDFIPQNMRSQWIDTEHNRIFLDTYNANPDSMMASIQTVQFMRDKPLALILGDMFELGDHSSYEHHQILLEAAKVHPELLITVGQHFYKVRGRHPLSFINLTDLIAYLRLNPIQSYTVLVKGSRGMKMEDILFLL
jgi:UDP-N-acetylmuramoyl-tripeptide--D-alanyl-D-alanine ligase